MSQEKRLKERVRTAACYKKTFSTDEGQEVLDDLMKSLFALSSTFDPTSTHQTTYNEGRRSVLLSILNTMELDIDQYLKAHREAMENQENFE